MIHRIDTSAGTSVLEREGFGPGATLDVGTTAQPDAKGTVTVVLQVITPQRNLSLYVR